MPVNLLRISFLIAAASVLAACSNGGGSSSDGDSGDRDSNSEASIQLNDGDVLGGGNTVIEIPAVDDTGIVQVGSTIVRQGNLSECSGRFADDALVASTLIEACVLDQPTCAVTFQPVVGQIEVIPPPLYAPIAVEYDITVVDRDGSITEPVRAVFCFDVGLNAPPVTAPDTYQLTYPSRIERSGVRYNDRCYKADGSQGVLANDEDDEHITNTCLRAELVDLPTYASNLNTFQSTFGSDGSFIYEAFNAVPPEDSSGFSMDSFTYRVTDGVNPVSEPVRVEIIFADSENTGPIAASDSYTINEDSGFQEFAVLENDFDPDALPLSIVSVTNGPGNGVANIRNGAVIEYRPNAGFTGQDNFTYTVQDSGGLTVTADVTINVANVNDAPVAQNDSVSTNENVSVVVQVLGNDSDAENDSLSVVSAANPLHGSTTVNSDGTVRYTPDTGYSGPDSFEYTITDGSDTATATVVVNVVFVNVAPVASADNISVAEETSGVFNLLDNDTDGDNDQLTIVSVGSPANGTVTLLDDGNIRYTPNDGFNGSDSFSYTISDGTVESSARVSVNVDSVNDAPIATDDSASTAEDTSVLVDVLNNDSDPDGDALTVLSISNTNSGSATINSNNTVTFVPADSFSGTAGFSYVVDDGNGANDSASVIISVSNTNDAPVASDDNASTSEGALVVINVLSNDSDPDGDALTVVSISNTNSGSATINSNNTVTFVPADSFSGTASFSYVVDDGNGATDSASVTISVSDINSAPVASDDNASTSEGAPVVVNVLSNDSDPDGDTLTVLSISTTNSGSASINSDNTVTFTPVDSFSGQAGFSYVIDDGNGATDSASVGIQVSNTNVSPIAVDDTRSTEEGDPVGIQVLDNDSDPDGDSLTVSVLTQPSNGSASITSQGDVIVYRPAAGFSGSDSFTYQISDGNGGVASATVIVTVSSDNVAPVAQADAAQTSQGVAVTIAVLANDNDPDGDTLTVGINTPPSNGTASVPLNNTIVYTPTAAFAGVDTIVYSIADGNGGTATATITVTVVAVVVNNPPTAGDDVAQATQGQAVNFNILANDADPDGDTLTVIVSTPPDHGTATVLADNRIRYTPDAAYAGADSIGYTVDDGNGGTDTATVTITVVSSNLPPVANDDSGATPQGQAISIAVLGNDSDPDGNTLAVTEVSSAANGDTDIAGGAVVYTPAAGFSGTDLFSYTVSDNNGGEDSATVTVTVVAAVNTPPVAVSDTATTDEGTTVNVVVLANDSDADGDALAVAIDTGPASGFAAIATDNSINYQPAPGFIGTDSFVYVIDDGNATDVATVSITVTAVVVANSLPVAVDDIAATEQDVAVNIIVLVNDSDVDGDPLVVAAVGPATNGTTLLNADGSVGYTPDVGYIGPDAFAYTIDDNVSGTASANVAITVTAAPVVVPPVATNTAPEAFDDVATASVNSVTRIRVLDNDIDADGDTLTLVLDATQPPSIGAATIHNNGRWINYTASVAGADSFGYTIDDGNGGTDFATVTVAVSDL